MSDTPLEAFIRNVIKENEDYHQGSSTYGYLSIGTQDRVMVSAKIFKELLAMRAYSPFIVISSLYMFGSNVFEDSSLADNEAMTFKKYYYNGDIGSKGGYHSCLNNKSRYTGFTEIYDYCTVCDKKFELEKK